MGTHTTGNCRPFAFQMVMICTAWASDSIRLAVTSPSKSTSPSDSGGWSSSSRSPAMPDIPWLAPLVHQFGQVVQIGHVPVTVELTQEPRHHVGLIPDRGQDLGHRVGGEPGRPTRQPLLEDGQLLVRSLCHP